MGHSNSNANSMQKKYQHTDLRLNKSTRKHIQSSYLHHNQESRCGEKWQDICSICSGEISKPKSSPGFK